MSIRSDDQDDGYILWSQCTKVAFKKAIHLSYNIGDIHRLP